MAEQVDLLVIGGGPAGYAGAIRGRQLGQRVVVVEKDSLGGTCLNRGCIPTKSFLESAALYRSLKRFSEHGISVAEPRLDFTQVVQKKRQVVEGLVGGLDFLLSRKEIEIVNGEAQFVSINEVQVQDRLFAPQRILVCTGTEAVKLPGLEPDGRLVVNSDQILERSELPESLLIVGGGVIGCEFATVFASYGVDVTIVELTNRLLPTEDAEISKTLLREFKKRKIRVLTGASVKGLKRDSSEVHVQIEIGNRIQDLTVDRVLVSVGRRPIVPHGFPGQIDNRGHIVVDSTFKTSVDHIFAAGDVIGGLQLAHLAFEEGMAACSFAFGEESKSSWYVPRCVYTQPEIGAVGLSEEEAVEQYGQVQVGRYSLKGNGKAVILNDNAGFCKIIATDDGIVRGVHMIGPHATELIAGAAVVLQQNMKLKDWADVVYPHPTVAESIKETVWSALGRGLHSI